MFLVTFLAGYVKGAVGFAMPMIMISGLGSIIDPKLAIAGLILPTLATNTVQAFRHGYRAAIAVAKAHWRYLSLLLIMIIASSQLVAIVPVKTLFLIIGIPVVALALIQLLSVRLTIPPNRRGLGEWIAGGSAGFLGGLSGVWGPPTVLYLTALNTPKLEQLRLQGVAYGLGALVLLLAHVQSGIFNRETAPFSAYLLGPAILGLLLGFRTSDALNQTLFRRATLIVLILAGLNLVRRGLSG